MLFDLRGRGRRRTVQAIYLSLAVIMGGGFVFLGVGGAFSGGGILDAFKNGGGSSATSADKLLDRQLATAERAARARPKDPAAWATVARARLTSARRAGVNGGDSATVQDKFARAYTAWQRYLAFNPKQPDVELATLVAVSFGAQGLNEPKKAVRALEVIAAQTKPPNATAYGNLSQIAYQAGETTIGDLARDKAVRLADPSQKKLIRAALDAAKSSAASSAGQATTTSSGP